MKMRREIIIVLLLCSLNGAFGQPDPLFSKDGPLDISLTISVREIKKTKGDSIYKGHTLHFVNDAGITDSIAVGVKGRGNSRLELCYFPPLWIKISKRNAKGTLFEGNKKLKLVLPCNKPGYNNELIIKEYLCYKLYEVIAPYFFKTRLVNIDLTEVWKKKKNTYRQKGILIEDADKTAKRFDAKWLKNTKISPTLFQDTASMRFDLFQYMISNTDWSRQFEHNSKTIYLNHKAIAIPYDFDMSGLVNAPYAVVSQINGEQLPIISVTQRYYRGICQSNEITELVKKEFLSKEEQFMSVPDKLKDLLPEKNIRAIKNYLAEFFTMLKKDGRFKNEIVDNCTNLH